MISKVLENISNIYTGLFAKPMQSGDVVYLQAKHFDDNGELATKLYPDLYSDDRINKHILKKGDVIFAAKGNKNFAACIDFEDITAVASTSFFVIRLTDNEVLPEYLAWFLNHPDTQLLLKGHARGTSIASISKVVLSDLKISIPCVQKQQLIINIYKLRNREKSLMHQIDCLKEMKIQQMLINTINR